MNHWSAAGDISRNIVRDKCLSSCMIVRSGQTHLFSEGDTRSLGHQFGLIMIKYIKPLFSSVEIQHFHFHQPYNHQFGKLDSTNISITMGVPVIWTSSLFRTYSRDFKSLNFPYSYAHHTRWFHTEVSNLRSTVRRTKHKRHHYSSWYSRTSHPCIDTLTEWRAAQKAKLDSAEIKEHNAKHDKHGETIDRRFIQDLH